MPGILEDPITGDFASRNEVEEEEEAAIANNLPEQYKIQPTVHITDDSTRSPSTLVVLIGAAASLLLNTAFGTTATAPPPRLVGSITVPELRRHQSPLDEEETGLATSQLHHPPHTFTLHTATTGTDTTTTLIACSRRPLPAEQAAIWVDTVLAEVTPAAVLVVCSMLSMDYRGPGDASEENLIFEIHTTSTTTSTTTSAEKDDCVRVPTLPPGTLITGLPAALLDKSEALGRPGSILVAVESSPVPEVSLACSLADAVSKMMGAGDGGIDGERRAVVAEAVHSMFRSSASNSMFI